MAEVKAPPLSPRLLKLAEYERAQFCVTIPPGVSLDSVLMPEFWGHVADRFVGKEYAKVECRAQDNKWYADLMVKRVDKQAVSMWVLGYSDLDAQASKPATADEYVVSFAPKQRWRVVRSSDGSVIHKDEATEADARAWLVANASTLAG